MCQCVKAIASVTVAAAFNLFSHFFSLFFFLLLCLFIYIHMYIAISDSINMLIVLIVCRVISLACCICYSLCVDATHFHVLLFIYLFFHHVDVNGKKWKIKCGKMIISLLSVQLFLIFFPSFAAIVSSCFTSSLWHRWLIALILLIYVLFYFLAFFFLFHSCSIPLLLIHSAAIQCLLMFWRLR